MRANRILRQMAGLVESPYAKTMKRQKRFLDRRTKVLGEEAMLIEMISRRQQGGEGTVPMPFKAMRDDLEKMAKGEI